MKICYIVSDRDGPGCYRCIFPASYLEKRGFEIYFPPWVMRKDGKGLIMSGKWPKADIYVLQRRMERDVASRIVPMLKQHGHKIVLEADDDDFHLPAWHPAFRGSHPSENPEVNRNWLVSLARQADAVSVSTKYLARTFQRYNRNVHHIPNYLEWSMWDEVTPVYEKKDWEGVRVGWMGAVKYREGDLRVLSGLIGPWLASHPDVKFVVAGEGAERAHDLLGVPEQQRVSIAGVDFYSGKLPDITATMDIGLAPLDDIPFNEAKSHLKGMEYNACGIPVIASATESYRDYVEEGVNGFLAKRPKDWLRSLDLLVASDDLRHRMGRAAREKAIVNSLDWHFYKWEAFFLRLCPPEAITVRAVCSDDLHAIQKPKELLGLLARAKGAEVVGEIGTHQGGTLFALSRVSSPTGTIVSLDQPGARYGEGFRGINRPLVVLPSQDAHFIEGDSHDEKSLEKVEEALAGKRFDVLMIDGDHSYEGVKQDFEMFKHLVRPGGLVAFHDIVTQEYIDFADDEWKQQLDCGVDRFWNEIKNEHEYEEIIDPQGGQWGGIGILYV